MSDDNAQIQISISTDDVAAGAERIKSEIAGIGESIDSFGEKLDHITEAFGVAFSIDALKEFIGHFAELGETIERTSAQLGISAEGVVRLSGVAKLTGVDLQTMATGIERMSLSIQKSTRDSTSPAAQSLKALGLNAKDLIGLPADQYFERLADAVSKFNPSLNLTNLLTEVGGRGMAQLVPALLAGGERYRELAAAAKQASEGVAASAKGAAETKEKIALLDLSMQSLGTRIFTTLKPAIDGALTWFTKLVQGINSGDIIAAAQVVGNTVISIADAIGHFVIFVDGLFDDMRENAGRLGAALKVSLSLATGNMVGALKGLADLFTGTSNLQGSAERTAAAYKKLDDYVKSARDNLKAASDAAAGGTGAGGGSSAPKANAPAINTGAKDQLEAAMKAADDQIALAQKTYQEKVTLYAADAAQFKITEDQKFALLEQADAAQFTTEMSAVSRLESMRSQMTMTQRQQLDDKVRALQQKHNTDMLKLDEQSIANQQKLWENGLGAITGAFNSNLKGLLEGTTTWSAAMKSTLENLTIKFIGLMEQWVVEHAAAQLGMTTAATTGAAARAAAETAGQETSMIATIGNALKSIFSSVGVTIAGVTAAVAPEVGPAAPAVGDAAGAASLAAALAVVPALDVGTNRVTMSGLAFIHQGEEVRPASTSGPWQNNSSNGGRDTHLHVHGPYQGVVETDVRKFAKNLQTFLDVNRSYRPKAV